MALLSKVRKVAGAAWCTPRTLREYFRNKRDVRAKEMVRNNLAAATRPGRKLDIRKIFGADGHRHAATDPAVHRICTFAHDLLTRSGRIIDGDVYAYLQYGQLWIRGK